MLVKGATGIHTANGVFLQNVPVVIKCMDVRNITYALPTTTTYTLTYRWKSGWLLAVVAVIYYWILCKNENMQYIIVVYTFRLFHLLFHLHLKITNPTPTLPTYSNFFIIYTYKLYILQQPQFYSWTVLPRVISFVSITDAHDWNG